MRCSSCVRSLLSAAALAFAAAAPVSAQQATTWTFGSTACNVPLQVVGAPRPGSTITFVGTGSIRVGRWLAVNHLMFGLSNTAVGGAPLPIPMSTLFPSLSSCGDLLQSADAFALMPETTQFAPTAFVPIAIPNAPSMVGLVVFVQTAQVAECRGYCAPQSLGVIASNGVGIRVGV